MAEFKHYKDVGIPVMNPAPEGHPFLGGKQDDVTITLAQVFTDKGPDDPHRQLSANDTYFPKQKTLYTGGVYSNKKEGFKRARFNSRNDKTYKPVSKDAPTTESVNKLMREAREMQM